MAVPDHIQKIVNKIEKKEPLTREEEITYYTEVMGYTKEEAENILDIVENNSETVHVD